MKLYRASVTLACALAGLACPPIASSAPTAPAEARRHAPWDANLQHTGWTRKDGAPAGLYSMTQDADGLLWFAARDGLYSFDGARFVRNDSVHGHRLHSPVTMSVAAIGEAIWVGYQFGGISRFDRSGVRHYVDKENSPQGTVHQIAAMPDGTLWATSSWGLFCLDGDAWRRVGPEAGLPAGGLLQMTMLKDGSMLVYLPQGVYRSAASGAPGRYTFTRIVDQPGVEGGELQPDGKVLMNSSALGMQMFDPGSGELTPFRLESGGLPNLGYTTDAHGGLWVGTGESVRLFDARGKLVRQFVMSAGFTGHTFGASLTDREGNVWFVTQNGVDRVRPARLSMADLPPGFAGAIGVTPGDDGAVWIGGNVGQGMFDMRSVVLAADGTSRRSAIGHVTASHRQPDGTLWFASKAGIWEVRGGSARRLPRPAAFLDREIQAMTTDREGRLWASVIGMGVHTYKEGVWQPAGGRTDLPKDTAITLSSDAQGRIWFGYTDNRIAVLDANGVRRFDAAQGLAIGNTLAIVHGRQRVWVGGDRGLAWFDGRRFVTVGERGRGEFRGVSGIVERADGELWLHDTGGLARIDAAALAGASIIPATVPAERFDHLDGHRGMPAQIRPLPSLVQSSDGRLWFATSSGVGHVDPSAIPRNPRAPTVMIGALRTDRQEFAPHALATLPARTQRLEIDFTATALTMPERVRFRYRLAGQDPDWRDAGGLRQAVYTNLAPGPTPSKSTPPTRTGSGAPSRRAPPSASNRPSPRPRGSSYPARWPCCWRPGCCTAGA